ncbi:hypothetical protein [Salinicoccus albus]|uniref:hypothetical protein n=1 Tax=Salinicoccus albus TaxID=418756 RepID=UPI00036EBE1C|nr:hypothetical protein [Salinicoccus albus]
MELLPLLIFIGGIVYTAIASQSKKKSNEEKRNIDRSKMDRQAGKVRQQVQDRRSSSTQQNSDRGLFDSLKGEIERSFGGGDESDSKSSSESSRAQPYSRPSRQAASSDSDRPQSSDGGRNIEETARESQLGQKIGDTYKDKVPADRSKQRERAEKARNTVYSGGIDQSKAEQKVSGLGREAAEESGYSLDEEEISSDSENRERTDKPAPVLTKGDLNFDRKAVVNGIIFSEILGRPKSKK